MHSSHAWPAWSRTRRALAAAIATALLVPACSSSSRGPPPAPTYVLRILVQPEGVWREDALSGRQGPLEEVRYEAEYVQLTVVLEGGAQKELVATLAEVRVTREGELFLDGKRVAEQVRGVTVAETVRDVSGSASRAAVAEEAGDVLLGVLLALVFVGALTLVYVAGGSVYSGNPWGPD